VAGAAASAKPQRYWKKNAWKYRSTAPYSRR